MNGSVDQSSRVLGVVVLAVFIDVAAIAGAVAAVVL